MKSSRSESSMALVLKKLDSIYNVLRKLCEIEEAGLKRADAALGLASKPGKKTMDRRCPAS